MGVSRKEIASAKSRELTFFSAKGKNMLIAEAWSAKEAMIGDRANKSDLAVLWKVLYGTE